MSHMDDEEGLLRDDSGLLHEDEPVRSRLSQWWHKFFKTLCLSFSFFVLGLCISIPGPTLLDLGERVHADTGPMTLVFTGRSLGYLVGSILGGVLFDHFNKQLLLFFTLFVASFATVAVPWSLTLTVLALLIAIQGVAMGVLDTGGNVFCIRIWGKKNAPYMQTLHFAFGVGAFIAPLLAKPFLSNQGFLEGDNSTRVIKGFIPVVTDISHLVNHSKRFVDLELYTFDINSDISFPYDNALNNKLTLHRREEMSVPGNSSSKLKLSGTNSSSPLTPIPGNSSGSNETFLSTNQGLTPSTNSDSGFNLTSVSLTSSTSPTKTTLAKKPVHSSDQYLNMAHADGVNIPGHLNNNKPGAVILEPSKPKETTTEKNRLRDVTLSPGVNETSSLSRNESSVVPELSKMSNASTERNSNKSKEASVNATESSEVSRITQNVTADPTKLNETPTTKTTSAVTITKSRVTEMTSKSIQTTQETLPSTKPLSHTSGILPVTSMTSQSTTNITPSSVKKGTATTETILTTSSAVAQNSRPADIAPNPLPFPGAEDNKNGSEKVGPKKNTDKGEGKDMNGTKESAVGPQKPKQTGIIDHPIEAVKNISKIQFAYLIIGLLLLLNSIMYLVMFCRDRNRYQYNDLHDILGPVCKSRPFYRIFLLTLLFFLFFAYVGMEVTYGGLIATFAVEFSHWSKDQGTVVTAIFWGALATGRGFSIFISQYFPPPCMLVIDLVLMIFGSLVLCTALYAYEPLLWVGTLILGLGMSSVFPTGISWAESRMHLTGKATAVFIVGSALGEMVIPATTGYLYDKYDYIKLMQVMLSLSIFSTVIFTVLQCVAAQPVYTMSLKDKAVSLPLEDGNEETCELEAVKLGRRNENLRFKSKKGKEYQSLIEDLDDD